MKAKYFLLTTVFIFFSFVLGFFFRSFFITTSTSLPKIIPQPTPLTAYTIENLAETEFKQGTWTQLENISVNDNINSSIFSFSFSPYPKSNENKSTTGIINIPVSNSYSLPLVLLIRGYVDQKIYTSGMGSMRVGEYFAQNGFITIAPDFLGYAKSSTEADNIFETRFQTYTTILSLLSSINSDSFRKLSNNKWDGKNIFIWAHSNGGQIALSLAVIKRHDYPTTLWAPVTKPFPYSVLYYTDEAEDNGKFLRKELAEFEALYNADLFSFTNYLPNINAPLQLHQGTLDDAVQPAWSKSFVKRLNTLDKNINYFEYPADHNLNPYWNEVVKRDLEFFKKYIKN